jgi:hypothetical protein
MWDYSLERAYHAGTVTLECGCDLAYTYKHNRHQDGCKWGTDPIEDGE